MLSCRPIPARAPNACRGYSGRWAARPILGGGFGHFYAYAPMKIEYAIDRFAMEVKRQLDVLDRRLAESEYIAGSAYTIADMAIFPWYGGLVKGWLYGAAEFLSVQEYKNVQRWADTLLERPAVKRGRMVNRVSGDPSSQLHERHDASDFATKDAGQTGGQQLSDLRAAGAAKTGQADPVLRAALRSRCIPFAGGLHKLDRRTS